MCIVDVHQDVRAVVRLRPIAQHRCLDLVEIKRDGTVALICLIRSSKKATVSSLLMLQTKSDGRDKHDNCGLWMPASGMLCFPVAIHRFGCITLYFTSMLPLVANEYGHT